jgi:hypothetical protein
VIIGVDIGKSVDHTAIVCLDGGVITDVQLLPLGMSYVEITRILSMSKAKAN